MTRARKPFLASLASRVWLALALAGCLLFSRSAEAKYAPPPAPPPGEHVVTTVGWLSPSDMRKINEESEIARTQTGFVIDVLLAPSDEPIDEVATETFKAWQPGDPGKGNGLLLVVQPNFPRGQRKVRLSVGPDVESKIPASKGKELLLTVLGPLINTDSDQVRTALAAGVMEIAARLGADESHVVPLDIVAPPTDGGVPDISKTATTPPSRPSATASGTGRGPSPVSGASSDQGSGGGFGIAVGAGVVVVLGALLYLRTRRKS